MDSCYADWNASMTKNQEEYAQWQAKRKEEGKRMNSEVKVLLQKFENLPLKGNTLTDMTQILDWFCKYQPYSDNILCTEKKDSFVIETLKEKGFVSNANIKLESYTAEEMFIYIVGQAISTMEMVALHGVIISFVAKWKKAYLKS